MPASLIMSLYEKAWQAMQQRIARAAGAAGRDPATIRLLAVSKSMPVEAIRAVHALGQRAFGENYVQEATAKMTALADLPDIVMAFDRTVAAEQGARRGGAIRVGANHRRGGHCRAIVGYT
jgi:uncharacterized pyridoxal phosphate-containing UPF0001 family protein